MIKLLLALAPLTLSAADTPLEPYRLELLQLGFETAASFPDNHHYKNRGRALETVAAACFELGQPERALGYIEHITSWRRGAGYADYALYLIEHSDEQPEVQTYLERALHVAATSEDALTQEWRADQIRSKVAVAKLLLGQTDEAERLEAELEPSEAGRTEAVSASYIAEEDFEAKLAELEQAAALRDFDQTRAAVDIYVRLYERFFDDEARAEQIEAALVKAWDTIPLMLRIEARLDLAGIAAERLPADAGAGPRGLAQLALIEAYFESHRWKAEDQVPLLSRLAVLRQRLGQPEAAREQLEAALTLYDESREGILNFDRARTLRPVAKACAQLGDTERALALFRRVVEEGAVNPNLKPRIDDLTDTCNAMAVAGVEPDAELWKQMRAIQAELAERMADQG